jgi:hypothetical protein
MSVKEKAIASKQHFDSREFKAATKLFVEVRDELVGQGKEVVQLGDGSLGIVIERNKDGDVVKTELVASAE